MNYWDVQGALTRVLENEVVPREDEKPILSSYWQAVEATNQVLSNDIGDGGTWGMKKFISEGAVAKIQKAVMDFLSQEFRAFPKDEVMDAINDRPEHYADQWLKMAGYHGLNNHGAQRLGWKYIMTGEFIDLPGGDRYV